MVSRAPTLGADLLVWWSLQAVEAAPGVAQRPRTVVKHLLNLTAPYLLYLEALLEDRQIAQTLFPWEQAVPIPASGVVVVASGIIFTIHNRGYQAAAIWVSITTVVMVIIVEDSAQVYHPTTQTDQTHFHLGDGWVNAYCVHNGYHTRSSFIFLEWVCIQYTVQYHMHNINTVCTYHICIPVQIMYLTLISKYCSIFRNGVTVSSLRLWKLLSALQTT